MVGCHGITENCREESKQTNECHVIACRFHSKDTLDIQTTKNESLKSCILISKGDGSDEKISIKKAKSVHFADALGKPLKSVKTLADPYDNLFGLSFLTLRSSTRRSFSTNMSGFQQKDDGKTNMGELVNFKSPLEINDLKTRVQNENVCLDKISFTKGNGIFGTIVVRNICFEKDVNITYTLDNWKSKHSVVAKYVSPACVENADIFTFEIVLSEQECKLNTRVNILFAICFMADGVSYWDSNFGSNYSIIFKFETDNNEHENSNSSKDNGFILPKQNFIGWAT